jgi:hypothetical protein
MNDAARDTVRRVMVVVVAAAAGGATMWLLGRAAAAVAGSRTAPWIIGRASGVTAYLLLFTVVATGLALAHPWRTRIRRPSSPTRIRIHAALTTFTLAFTVLHIVVLATDEYAGVGWRGAILPMGATYRPVPVTLGLVGLYAGLLAGLTAALAGRVTARLWWPLHKVAAVSFGLVWAHGLLAGSDNVTLRAGYLVTGAVVVALAVSRYVTTTPADRFASVSTLTATAPATAPAAAPAIASELRRVS